VQDFLHPQKKIFRGNPGPKTLNKKTIGKPQENGDLTKKQYETSVISWDLELIYDS